VQSDRKILIFGTAERSDLAGESGGERLNEDGTFDDTFNSNGRVTFDNPHLISAIALENDKILVAGANFDGRDKVDFGIARLNHDGSMDSSFGDGGLVDTDFGFTVSGLSHRGDERGTAVVACREGSSCDDACGG